MAETVKTIEIYADTKGFAACRSNKCRQRILWAEVAASGAKMCFSGEPVPVATREDLTGRVIEAMPFDDNHWATCAGRDEFKNRG